MKSILVMTLLIGATAVEAQSDPLSPPQCQQRKYELTEAARRYAAKGREMPIREAECVEVVEEKGEMDEERSVKSALPCPPKTDHWKPRC